jgi:hypothetical protein
MITKTLWTFLLLMLLIAVSASGQAGIYQDVSDYRDNKISYEARCRKHRQAVRLHDFFVISPNVTVLSGGKKYRLKKSKLFGYRDCDNVVYRFYNNTAYHIAEAGKICIYIQTRNIPQGKSFKIVNDYYFSSAIDSGILSLSLVNLKAVYHNNEKFLDLLDQFFSCCYLHEYDNIHHTFKVNYVYNKSLVQ